jgi:hypothetical protein
MIDQAQQAGSKILVCTLPITQDGSEGTLWPEQNFEMPTDEADFNQSTKSFRGEEGWNENGIVDLATAIAGTQWN